MSKTIKVFTGGIVGLALFVTTVVVGVHFVSVQQERVVTQQSESLVSALSLSPKNSVELSATQLEIADESFELLEDYFYDLIVRLDNSKSYNALEDEIMDRVEDFLDDDKKAWIIAVLGDEYVDTLYRQAYFKIRSKVDRQYDVDNYIDDIVDNIMPRIEAYRREIVRRMVMDQIYSRVSDKTIECVAQELVDEARNAYAHKLKEMAEEGITAFMDGDSKTLPKLIPADFKGKKPTNSQAGRKN